MRWPWTKTAPVAVNVQPLFPVDLLLQGGATPLGVKISLNLDGSWDGDVEAVAEAMASLATTPQNVAMAPGLWAMLREMRQDARNIAPPPHGR
jgi:hypothetical protein